jgi:hypothetical protein
MSSSRKAVQLLVGTMGMLLLCLPAFSQGNFGRILGTVTDQSGGVIAGATVTVLDTQRGVARTLTTDDAGEYNAPTLLPGNYTVRAEAKGFKKLERQNIVLEVGKEVRIDLTVQPGGQEQTVMVTESIPMVETTNATLGGTLNNSDINDLPLNGRNYQSLLALRPGVMTQPGGGPWTQSTNNVRPDESAWMVDGVINANFYDARPIAGMPSPITDGGTILPIDAIQEFNLEENPKAEYGWKPGAVVNVGIKSGTNSLHGSAYAFGRDDSFNARNIFNVTETNGTCMPNPGSPAVCNKTPQQLEQFGGVVGGPIKKDKLFFFAGYEGLRSSIGNAFAISAPATASLPTPGTPNCPAGVTGNCANSMVDAILGLQNKGIPVSPVSLALLGCPSGPLTASSTCTGGVIQNSSASGTSYLSTFPNTNTSDNGIAKLDYHINSKNQLTGMLFIGNYSGVGEDHGQVDEAFTNTMPIRVWSIVANWIWTPNSRWVNEARFGYDRMSFDFGNTDTRLADGSGLTGGAGYPVNTGLTATPGLPDVTIAGFATLGGWKGRPFENSPDPYSDFQDNISYLRGKHSFKFGGEFTHIEADWALQDRGQIFFGTNKTGGSLAFGGSTPLEDFFAGDPNQARVLTGGAPVRRMIWTETAGFAQDDWRVTQKVTVNVGLRYSYESPFTEVNGLLGSFNPTTGLAQQGVGGLNTLWKPDYRDFSPRLGFAWDVTGKGTTVVRGGGSIIYSSTIASNLFSQPGFQNAAPSTNISDVPTGACNVSVPIGSTCAAQGGSTLAAGGTIQLATKVINSTSLARTLNWDPTITGNTGPVFPTAGLVPSCTAAARCAIMAVDPNLTTPYIVNYTMDVQHAFTNNLSLEVGYVGDQGSRLTGFRDINQINPATGARPFATQFPYLSFINQMSNDAHSNYNSLQATLTERTSHGLSFIAGYTYAHGLDNGSLNRFGLLPQNSQDVAAEYASSDFDVRHRFTFTASYDIPGKKGFGQLLEGWKLNAILTIESAQPWTVNDYSNDFSGSGDTADRWDFFGNPADFKEGTISIPYCSGFGSVGGISCSQVDSLYGQTVQLPASLGNACMKNAPDPTTLATGGCFVSGNSVMVPPTLGTFGTMGRNLFRDNGYKDVDFSIFKNFTFRERFNAQFRVEIFNLFNHPTIANPYGASNGGAGNGFIDPSVPKTFGCGCSTPDFIAGSPIVSSGDSRVMQLGLKFTF